MKHINKFEKFKKIEESIRNPHDLIVGNCYKITIPVYDDYDEGLLPETTTVKIISKKSDGFIVQDVNDDFTYKVLFRFLMDCKIEYEDKI